MEMDLYNAERMVVTSYRPKDYAMSTSWQTQLIPNALFVWTCLADKLWLKVLLADLVCEKNIVRWLKKYGL